MKKLFILTAGAALLISAIGCQTLKEDGIYADPTSDAGIEAFAASRLNSDSMVAAATLDVSVVDGVATLKGILPDSATRQRALSILSGVDGITRVVDHTRIR